MSSSNEQRCRVLGLIILLCSSDQVLAWRPVYVAGIAFETGETERDGGERRIAGATIVIERKGVPLQTMQSSDSGWFESQDLGSAVRAGDALTLVAIREGYELHRGSVTIGEGRTYVELGMIRLKNAVDLPPLTAQITSMLHGFIGDVNTSSPVAGARVSVRTPDDPENEVGYGYTRDSGYFSVAIPRDLKRTTIVAVDHPLFLSWKGVVNFKKPFGRDLHRARGSQFFAPYPEVFGLSGADLSLYSVTTVFGENKGFTAVSADFGRSSFNDRIGVQADSSTYTGSLESSMWQIDFRGIRTKALRDLSFHFGTTIGSFNVDERRLLRAGILRGLPDIRSMSSDTQQEAIRDLIDIQLAETLDGREGALEGKLREDVTKRKKVSSRLAEELGRFGTKVKRGDRIRYIQKGRSWQIFSNEGNHLVIMDGTEMMVFPESQQQYITFTNLDAGGELNLDSLKPTGSEEELWRSAEDWTVVQTAMRRPVMPRRRWWTAGLQYSVMFPREETVANGGLGIQMIFSVYPVATRIGEEETNNWRTNFSFTVGAGYGGISEVRPGKDEVGHGFFGSAGLGYRFGPAVVSLGWSYLDAASGLSAPYVALGINFLRPSAARTIPPISSDYP